MFFNPLRFFKKCETKRTSTITEYSFFSQYEIFANSNELAHDIGEAEKCLDYVYNKVMEFAYQYRDEFTPDGLSYDDIFKRMPFVLAVARYFKVTDSIDQYSKMIRYLSGFKETFRFSINAEDFLFQTRFLAMVFYHLAHSGFDVRRKTFFYQIYQTQQETELYFMLADSSRDSMRDREHIVLTPTLDNLENLLPFVDAADYNRLSRLNAIEAYRIYKAGQALEDTVLAHAIELLEGNQKTSVFSTCAFGSSEKSFKMVDSLVRAVLSKRALTIDIEVSDLTDFSGYLITLTRKNYLEEDYAAS